MLQLKIGMKKGEISMINKDNNSIITCKYLDEPRLRFADGREQIDPKLGISRYGPKSLSPKRKHPDSIRVGFIGSGETINVSMEWLTEKAKGVLCDENHIEFPGFMQDRGFYSQLLFDSDWNAQITKVEMDDLLKIRPRERFEILLSLLEDKIDFLSKKDQPPQYIVIALPDAIYNRCKVSDYYDSKLGNVHRDLRRAFKATAMKYQIPTQFIRQQTVDGRENDDPSKVAWNFFTGLYFKAGGIPWGPIGLSPGTCYIGIAFSRPLGSKNSSMQTSIVQAFDEHGDGLILRGPEFHWNTNRIGSSKSPHLSSQDSSLLINQVLDRYSKEMGQTPQRVVVHKSSRFWPEEEEGFKSAISGRVKKFDLIALETRQSHVRLLTTSSYPPLRGTWFKVGNVDYLYTTGFISELGQSHVLHVPSPIQLTDHVGRDTPREVLLKEILILTKMNWNSSRLGGKAPITLRFSDLVGEIMREIPNDREPMPQFKFYM
jgi:hypothetical protein